MRPLSTDNCRSLRYTERTAYPMRAHFISRTAYAVNPTTMPPTQTGRGNFFQSSFVVLKKAAGASVAQAAAQAALGAELQVPTLDGKVSYTIPEGTQTGREFILRGKGIPQVGNPKLRGDHHFSVVVETPTRLTNEQRELLRQCDGTVSRSVTPKRKGFQDILNDFFKEK